MCQVLATLRKEEAQEMNKPSSEGFVFLVIHFIIFGDDMSAINKPKQGDLLYTGGLNGQVIQVYAPTGLAAKELVLKYFKPSKKNLGLVWMVLNSSPEAMQ